MTKRIVHYWDTGTTADVTLCGRTLTKTCWVYWTINRRQVTCKVCLRKMGALLKRMSLAGRVPRLTKLGERDVLFNHASHCRWEKAMVYQRADQSYAIRKHNRWVTLHRLYTDSAKSALTGRMRLSNRFMTTEAV